jgi:hypothetical protein
MKFKSYKSEVLDVNEKGIVTIAIGRFDNEDMGGDIARKGAFERTFKEGINRIKHYMDHSLKQSANVGLPVKMYETDKHPTVESALNLEKQISRDLFSDYKFFKEHGRTLEHSYGYETIKGKPRYETIKGKQRTKGEEILELKMYEYSTVGLGMNPETPLLDLKSFEAHTLEEYLRKYDVSNQRGKQIELIIKQIKEFTDQATHNPEPSTHNPVKKLNELLTTKNIF